MHGLQETTTDDRVLLVVQLSDFHVRQDDRECLRRAEGVVAAIRPLARYASACVVALTGDLTFSGDEDQFTDVAAFVEDLRARLAAECGTLPVTFAVVPGNHDCDFSINLPVRAELVAGVASQPDLAADSDRLRTCMQPLANYASFARDFYSPKTSAEPSDTAADPQPSLATVIRFDRGDGNHARILCLQTSWCSQRHEVPGALAFPHELIPEPDPQTFTIVLMHHPLQWFDADNAKLLRSRLEATSDLILTGHEHEPDCRSINATSGDAALYLEGGLFQVTSTAPATFNVVSVDVSRRRYCHMPFTWDTVEQGFRAAYPAGHPDNPASWPELPLARKRAAAQYVLTHAFESSLDEPGIALEHPSAGRVSLSQLYTVPDLRELEFVNQTRASVVASNRVLDHLAQLGEVLITGDSQSGKTSLAKRLFIHYRARGFVPVMLTGPRKPCLGRELDRELRDAFSEQYESPSSQAFEQLASERKAIIIDDLHLMSGKAGHRRTFRQEIQARAAHVVYFAHDIAISIEDLVGFDDDDVVRRYQIQPLGHARRAELIERWAALGDENDSKKLARIVNDTTRLVNAIIGKNFVPPYPPYVLSLVQAQAATTVVDTSAGTHGYFYELLIRCALARESTTDEYDVTMAYLAHLASAMMRMNTRVLTTEQLRRTHEEFEHKVDVALDYERQVGRLTRRNILAIRSGEVTFKYAYLHYYFSAIHLRDTLSTSATRSRIVDYTRALHVEESSNILLFLAHLTKDAFVLDALISAGKALVPDAPMARLDRGEDVGADMAALEASTAVFLERDPDEVRMQAFAEMDAEQREAEIAADRAAAQEPTADMIKLFQSLAALQLLGQVVKNFPGTLEADRKAEIVGECYALGRRLLGWYLGLVRTNNTNLVAEVARALRQVHSAFALEKLVRRAQEIVSGFVAAGTFGIVRRVSHAVGSRHLQRTYRKVYDDSVPVVQLFDFSLRLDHDGDFPLGDLRGVAQALEGNRLPFVVLRALVTQHFNLFPVGFREKQAACEFLGMKYDRREILFREMRLLPDR
jgi:predicted phosphodiesterase